ncbi:MAG TPA: type III pantothenate kinase [Bacillota bacterium]|nr:type III pantothenate kinase [Bacillota bacterium]HPF41900.1 type III pantothenate kinase [Bacillota bacterium]HPJ85627.1 type III pantothenate kinase [Bacillota bacterium]
MLVLIDIGNSTIAIGLSTDGKTIVKKFRISTGKSRSSDEYAIILDELIENADQAIVASVVPELNEVFRDYFSSRFGFEPIFLASGVKTGIRIFTDTPKEVGADIIADCVAASQIYSHTCLIIDMGTATTMTYIENSGIKGVIIAPGLATSLNALISKASLLPHINLEKPSKLLGTNSPDSIKSGLIYGHASMVDGLVARVRKQTGNPDLAVVLTGGNAKIIYPECQAKMTLDEDLILKGLLLVAGMNATK